MLLVPTAGLDDQLFWGQCSHSRLGMLLVPTAGLDNQLFLGQCSHSLLGMLLVPTAGLDDQLFWGQCSHSISGMLLVPTAPRGHWSEVVGWACGGWGSGDRVKARPRIPPEKDRRDCGPPPEQWKC